MTNEAKAILMIMSRILDYPDQTLLEGYPDIEEYVNDEVGSVKMRNEILERISPLFKMPLLELQELYVETFDYKDKTGLYLTAHELGDSRKRGAALIKLQKLIVEGGFEYNGKEIVDYIPMLFELLAHAPEGENFERLYRRLAFAVDRIHKNLIDSNPYHRIMDLLMMFVFEAPEAEEITLLENQREKADLEDLPYPMFYQ
ncbi:nitrate reductase molybdenum cofactor assembly chaperone [Fredinandcohnia sp. QZ13]|uniref:nitrate reductase molybdenum cofactor assembly chaperone n=1 Tax=Fredinandcohnia sp. QZ13 TaxID=3073144 RepID=UPI0028533386|nr:nitrate reductase molybdenum cofactor assembly chaperone [Fredinandcohnia sp. QZ13]MDR4888007.1 nitrate reductase molybdenum cofactor assembly chaperone [Fredinandcohnia sp. QZ13]